LAPVAYARSRNRLVGSKYGGCGIDLAVTRRRAAASAAPLAPLNDPFL
jgi:hypothetical protein